MKKIIILSYVIVLLSSCEKTIQVDDIADFNVTTDSISYKAGTPVKFTITDNNFNSIYFYSGEPLKDYAFKSGRVINVAGQGVVLSFSTTVQTVGTQANQLSVLVSTNFNGDYTNLNSIKAATWTDITSRISLATSTTAKATSADVSDLVIAGQPFFIAFRYITKPQAVNGIAKVWAISSLLLASKTKLANTIALNFADQSSASFQLFDQNKATTPSLSSVTSSKIQFQGNTYDPLNPSVDPQSENWAISAPIKCESVDLGPDLSTPIKSITNSNISEYRYSFSTPGTYKVVFVAKNTSIDTTKSATSIIDLSIY